MSNISRISVKAQVTTECPASTETRHLRVDPASLNANHTLGLQLGIHPRRSPGTMTAKPLPPGSFTVATPNADIKRIPTSTRRPSLAWNGAARGGCGAPKRSSRQFVASDASTGVGPHRRISVRLMISPAMERYGAGSIPLPPRSNSLGPQTADRRRSKPGQMADQKRTDTGCTSKKQPLRTTEPRTQDG